MGTTKNGTYQVFNGTDYDTINFTTVGGDVAITDVGGYFPNNKNAEDALQQVGSALTIRPTKTTADTTYYVNTSTGNDANNGTSSGTPFKTIAKAISMLPQVINNNITINVADGTYNEEILIKGIIGCGNLQITGNTTTPANCIVTNIAVISCLLLHSIQGFTTNSTTKDTLYVSGSINFTYSYIISTVTASHAGCNAISSVGRVSNCTFSNKNGYAIVAQSNSDIISDTNSGSNNSYGLVASSGSTIRKNGSQPTGTTNMSFGSGSRIIETISPSTYGTTGFRYNDDGTLEQWGATSINVPAGIGSANIDINFPTPFPNQVMNHGATCTYNITLANDSYIETINASAYVISRSQIRIKAYGLYSGTPATTFEIRWRAIGY